jgi:hypothetical protein
MDKLSLEEVEERVRRQRAEHLRAVEDEVLRRAIEDEKRRAHRLARPEPKRPEGMSKDELWPGSANSPGTRTTRASSSAPSKTAEEAI